MGLSSISRCNSRYQRNKSLLLTHRVGVLQEVGHRGLAAFEPHLESAVAIAGAVGGDGLIQGEIAQCGLQADRHIAEGGDERAAVLAVEAHGARRQGGCTGLRHRNFRRGRELRRSGRACGRGHPGRPQGLHGDGRGRGQRLGFALGRLRSDGGVGRRRHRDARRWRIELLHRNGLVEVDRRGASRQGQRTEGRKCRSADSAQAQNKSVFLPIHAETPEICCRN